MKSTVPIGPSRSSLVSLDRVLSECYRDRRSTEFYYVIERFWVGRGFGKCTILKYKQ